MMTTSSTVAFVAATNRVGLEGCKRKAQNQIHQHRTSYKRKQKAGGISSASDTKGVQPGNDAAGRRPVCAGIPDPLAAGKRDEPFPGYLRSIRLRYGQGHHPVFFNDFLMDRLKMMKPRVAVTTYANYEIVITRRR